MNQEREMRAEREYLERVKMRLLDTIDEARTFRRTRRIDSHDYR